MKPGNVALALEPDGGVIPKLLDFGVSQTREWDRTSNRGEGVVVGTPWYMSPEQARGEDVDARCDVFGVGVLIYECLTGTNPFRVEGGRSGADQRRSAPRIETIPGRLWEVIARALAERREDRYASAAELAGALREAVAPSPRAPKLLRARLPARAIHALDFLAMVAVAAAVGFQIGVPLSAQESAGVVPPHASAECLRHPRSWRAKRRRATEGRMRGRGTCNRAQLVRRKEERHELGSARRKVASGQGLHASQVGKAHGRRCPQRRG